MICDLWDIVALFMGKSFYLLSKPGLLVTTMFISDALVLGADLLQDFVEVLLGRGVDLHIDCASKLRAQCCQLLNNKEAEDMSALIATCTDSNMKQAVMSANHYSQERRITRLCVIPLEVGQLILQALDLHLQVSLCEGGLVEQAAQVGDVCLN